MVEKFRIKPADGFDLIYTFCDNTHRIKGNSQEELEQNLKELLEKLKGYIVERDDIFGTYS